MEFLLLGLFLTLLNIVVVGIVVSSVWFFTRNTEKLISSYSEKVFSYSEIQKQNTAKLINLLEGAFVPSPKSSPNTVTKSSTDEIEFSEHTPLELNKNIKFEVEGGDSFIPPGQTAKN